jgi:hypothetical protein
MKLTKTQLREIIREEIKLLRERTYGESQNIISTTLKKMGFNKDSKNIYFGIPYLKEHGDGIIQVWIEPLAASKPSNNSDEWDTSDTTMVKVYVDYYPYSKTLFNRLFKRKVRDYGKQRNLLNTEIDGHIDLGVGMFSLSDTQLEKTITLLVKKAVSKL